MNKQSQNNRTKERKCDEKYSDIYQLSPGECVSFLILLVQLCSPVDNRVLRPELCECKSLFNPFVSEKDKWG